MGGKLVRKTDGGIAVYQYPKCGTCRKALRWLEASDIPYRAIDIVAQPPSLDELRDMWKRSGVPIQRLFNTSGESYRAGGFRERLPTMSEEEALRALAADGKLIKRPLVDAGRTVLVGFDEDRYTSTLGR